VGTAEFQGKTYSNETESVSPDRATTMVCPQQPNRPAEPDPNQSGSRRLDVARIEGSDDKGLIVKSGKVSWGRITERLQKPTVGPKDGPAVVFSSFRDSHRCADDVLEISALALDIEAKTEGRKATKAEPEWIEVIGEAPPPLQEIRACVEAEKWASVAHTTYKHHDPRIRPHDCSDRFRLILPLAKPLCRGNKSTEELKEDYEALVTGAAARLGLLGCLDPASYTLAQFFYEPPRVPQERADQYECFETLGQPLDTEALLAEGKALLVAQDNTDTTGNGVATSGQGNHHGNSVIAEFNAAHDVREILKQHGYVPVGARFLSPISTSGEAGIVILPPKTPDSTQRIFCHHKNDPLGDPEMTGKTYALDAFDVYRILEHEGDIKAAAAAARRLLGLKALAEGGPCFDAVMATVEGMDAQTLAPEIDAILADVVQLTPVEQDQLIRQIHSRTGIGLPALRRGLRQFDRDEESAKPDHLEFARSVVAVEGREDLISDDNDVWRYREGIWDRWGPRAIRQAVQQHLYAHHKQQAVTKSVVDSISDLVRNETYQPEHRWNVGPIDAVVVLNGELTYRDGQWDLQQHTRTHFRTTRIPVVYDPKARAPRLQRFLREVFEGDPDAENKVLCVLEMLGYTLMSHAAYERFILLIGNGANGKSVLLAVVEALCGAGNVSAIQPAEFGNRFQRAHLHLKLANIVTEIREGAVLDDAALKAITSGERTTVERKNAHPFEICPFATCWFGTNHLPHTRDFSDALLRRALLVQFNRQFRAGVDADPQLKRALLAELPGILNLALEAYARVVARGNFTEPASSVEAKQGWRLEADQVAQFIEECCEPFPGGRVSSKELYDAYARWARRVGISRTLKMRTFVNRVIRSGFGRDRNQHYREITGLRVRVDALGQAGALFGEGPEEIDILF
jgi:putative DNA primase/helicase